MRLVSAPRLDTKAFLPVTICAGTGAVAGDTYPSGGFGVDGLESVPVSDCCARQSGTDKGAAARMRQSAIQNLQTFPRIASSIQHNGNFGSTPWFVTLIQALSHPLKVTEPPTKNCKALPRIADRRTEKKPTRKTICRR